MIGIIGAMEEEITLLRKSMEDVSVKKIHSFEFFTGKIYGKEIVLLRSGIGKVQAAAGCATMINCYTPEMIINSGCAGGVNPPAQPDEKLKFGDAVISSAMVYHDFDLTVFGYEPGQVPGFPSARFSADGELVKKMLQSVTALRREGKLPPDFKAAEGLIASGDIFVADSNIISALQNRFPGLRAVDMESAAIAHCCAIFNIPRIALRCLSDIAGEDSPVVFDEYLPVAAKHSSEIVKRLIAGI